MRYLWVVEMWNEELERWEATVGARLSRKDGRIELKDWKENNCGRFRLCKYTAAASTSH